MKAAVVTFPGSNCDRDLAVAFETAGFEVHRIWHRDTALPAGLDVIGLPGGFSFGDYLRCGAIAANAPICREIKAFAGRGGHVLGVCNGFQILVETGLLPGALMRNANLHFICKPVRLRVESDASPYTSAYGLGAEVTFPVAHHDGNYQADAETLARLEGEGQVAFRYCDNPNGAARDIAGVLSSNHRVLGLMPHPERAIDPLHGGTDGLAMFTALTRTLVSA